MLEIVCKNIKKNYGSHIVLKDMNFEIKTNEKVALIGQNGCGKSTLLKMIAKEEMPTDGDIFLRKESSIEMLSQCPNDLLQEHLVKDIIYSSFEEINILKKQLDSIEEKMLHSEGQELEKNIIKYSKIQEAIIKKDGYEIDSKIDKIVAAFKVQPLLSKKYKVLSGGEKTIINLIYILLKEPDILLLDEPTNHLDMDMIEWLENFLINIKKTVIIVSHDRYFLDKVANKIILIDNGKEEIFFGNYSDYLKENEARIMLEFKNYKNQQKQIEAMKKSIKRLKEFGKLAYPCGENFYRRAASIEKRLEKLEVLDKPQIPKKFDLKLEFDKRSGNDVLKLEKYNLKVGEKELLKNATLWIKYQERICLIGKNGTGKSTLIKEIIGRGENIKLGSNIKIGYIPQEITFEREDETVIEEARKIFNGPEEILRSALSKFLFYADKVHLPLKKLSGGERLRLKLFQLMQEDNNFLILDEPTNHIDINTKEILEETLLNYKGTLLVISHDRYFINKIATRIIQIENHHLVSYIGNYNDMKETIKRQKEI